MFASNVGSYVLFQEKTLTFFVILMHKISSACEVMKSLISVPNVQLQINVVTGHLIRQSTTHCSYVSNWLRKKTGFGLAMSWVELTSTGTFYDDLFFFLLKGKIKLRILTLQSYSRKAKSIWSYQYDASDVWNFLHKVNMKRIESKRSSAPRG